jgi:hypothetical protein
MRGSGTARSLLAHARRVAVPPFRLDEVVKRKLRLSAKTPLFAVFVFEGVGGEQTGASGPSMRLGSLPGTTGVRRLILDPVSSPKALLLLLVLCCAPWIAGIIWAWPRRPRDGVIDGGSSAPAALAG